MPHQGPVSFTHDLVILTHELVLSGGSRFRKRQKLDRRGVGWGGALLENPRTSNVRGANSEDWWWARLRKRQNMG